MKRLTSLILIGCLAFLFTGGFASGAFAATPVDRHYSSITQLRSYVEGVEDLNRRQVLTDGQAQAQYDFYSQQASAIRGEQVTLAQLKSWNRFVAIFRVGTFIQVMVVALGAFGAWFFLGGVIARIMALAGELLMQILVFIWKLATSIPVALYELSLCGLGIFLMTTETLLVSRLLGATIFGVSLTAFHGVKSWGELHSTQRDSSFIAGVMTVSYGACAVFNQSIALGVLAALGFVSFFGFQTQIGTLTLALGFENEDQLASGTLAAGVLTVFGVVLAQGLLPGKFMVLQTGALFAGALVYYLGLDILSSKWYSNSNYFAMQLLTVSSGLAGIYAGAFYGLGVLTGVAGTIVIDKNNAVLVARSVYPSCIKWLTNKI